MKIASLDSETHLSLSRLAAPPIVCWSLANGRGAFLLSREQGLAWLRKALADPEQHIVGVNIAYDLACASAADPRLLLQLFDAYDAHRIHDVAIREALMDIAKGTLAEQSDDDALGIRYGMRLLAERYFGEDLRADKSGPESWRKRYAQLEHVPIEQWPWPARRYPLRDVALPLEIFKLQEGGRNLHREPDEVRAAFSLQLMSVWGLRTDGKRVANLRDRVVAEDIKNKALFKASGILREDGTASKARLAELVTKAYGGDPPRTPPSGKFPEGQVASDRDTLVESGDPLLEAYGRAGKNNKYLTTYLPILEQGVDVPWNPSFNVLVATTRVSSNAQQFPQKGGVRECFVPRPGFVFCSVDYGGLELRTMAQRALWEVGFSKMAEVLNSGVDAHVVAAASFMGITYEEALAKKKAGDPLLTSYRDLGKIYNFGKGGGMGPGAMVYNARKGSKGETTTGPDGKVYVGSRFCILAKRAAVCGTVKVPTRVQGKERRICASCLAVAKELDEGWLNAWLEQRALFAKASRITKSGRKVTAMIPHAQVERGDCGYTQYLNTPFQGLGAVATKRAMWRVTRECYDPRRRSPLFGSRLVLNVHDELIAELLEAKASEAGDRMAKIMRESLAECVPDLVPAIEAEPALSRDLNKKATTVRDLTGRLLVWDPAAKYEQRKVEGWGTVSTPALAA